MALDWHAYLATAGATILFLSVFPYILSIVRGETIPHLVTWIGSLFLTAISTAAQLVKGPSWSVVIPIVITLNTLWIVILSLRYGVKVFSTIDKVCFVLGIAAIVLWILTNEPLVALYLSILADFIFMIPTMIKTYKYPSFRHIGSLNSEFQFRGQYP